ncbi:MAG: proton-conducting membrane transporter [Defluviitaleaceae bacterium]|nr:proton-conducting membrane transporter [Defluviitaleaceae bacterium]MCL2836728.1 proton-conducting membrane transporter [Defluviitaleaceae bacterium]
MLTFLIIIPVLIAVLLFVLSTNRAAKILAIVFQSILFVASVYIVIATREADIVTFVGSYDDVLGIILRVNSLSAVFVLLTTFIFLAVSVYSYSYTEKRDTRTFWFLMFLLEASFIGLFLAGDLFNIFVLVEVSTLVTVILTMYDRSKRNIFHGKVFLMANVVVAQFFLIGLGYIYRLTGALDMERVTEALGLIDGSNLALPYVLIMTTVAFKCTLIPFFSWTPKARIYPNAPTVVAAILSGLQAKTALYLFICFQDMFQNIASQEFFLVIGIITGLFGAVMAICQSDIKMILAYHTVSQVGLIIIGISMGSLYSYAGGLYHIVSHAMFKTTLFLSTGIVIHSYGTSDVYKIRGVMKRMPVVGVATAAAVLGITGAPFFIGSISKYFIAYDAPPLLNIVTIVLSLGTIISFVKFSSIFFGHSELVGDIPKAEKCRIIPVFTMGAICLAGGLFGTQFIYHLFRFQVNISIAGYAQKSAIFVISAAAGYLIYQHIVKGNAVLKRLGAVNFSFKSVCASLGVFFAVLLVFIGFF